VDNLLITWLLGTHNNALIAAQILYARALLPTMKLQLMQLPLLVGSGRVFHGRALFLARIIACARQFKQLTFPVDEAHQKLFNHRAY
jgi:hypothetical protein